MPGCTFTSKAWGRGPSRGPGRGGQPWDKWTILGADGAEMMRAAHSSRAVVLSWEWLYTPPAPQLGHLSISGDIFECHTGGGVGATRVSWVEARVRQSSILQCTEWPRTTKTHPVPNVNSVEVENPALARQGPPWDIAFLHHWLGFSYA